MYTAQSYKKPFWAENSGFITGRDPLGIQNSSITTYTRLLPGITNLTLRIRYYGLYSWLLSVYSKEANNKSDNIEGHYNYFRRAELIVAFIMRKKFPDELSIIGSDYTDKREGDVEKKGFYDIRQGADKVSNPKEEDVYWDFPSGALGQYYAGSLIALKLISISERFFIIEPEGQKLAEAFESVVPEEQRTKFLKIIKSGVLTLTDIDSLQDFAINQIAIGSPEWNFYKSMLIGIDGPDILDEDGVQTYLRKETIGLYLEYINGGNRKGNDLNFIESQYLLNVSGKFNEASFGWYYYYLNEGFHFALETIFWTLLVQLDGTEQEVEDFIFKMTELVADKSASPFGNSAEQSIAEIINSTEKIDLISSQTELEGLVKSPINSLVAIHHAFQLMILIYKLTQTRQEEIVSFEKRYKVWAQKGRVSENLECYVEQSMELQYKDFVKETIKKILNDHINTAYRKMGNGESNLLKFIIEDSIITHIQTMTPRHTSPRLRTLSNIMSDLSFVHNNSHLTEEGLTLLKTISE
jgi:hypothetical protein